MSDSRKYEYTTTAAYDIDAGEIRVDSTFLDNTITDIIRVRQGLVEMVVRQACALELRRLGYTVIEPEGESE